MFQKLCWRNLFLGSGIFALSFFVFEGVQAQSADAQQNSSGLGSAQDCTEIQVKYTDNQTLTNDEKLALMDRALFKSLSQFDACQTVSNGDGSGRSGASGSIGGGNGTESIASTGMSGTETPTDSSQDSSADKFGDAEATLLPDEGNASTQESKNLDNGKIPEDIPLADNDSVLEAQIRQAAMNEKDPKTQKKLWDEYRRYKGLPVTK